MFNAADIKVSQIQQWGKYSTATVLVCLPQYDHDTVQSSHSFLMVKQLHFSSGVGVTQWYLQLFTTGAQVPRILDTALQLDSMCTDWH